MSFTGADVDGLDRLAIACRDGARTAREVHELVRAYAEDPRVFGPQRDRFRASAQTRTLPLLRRCDELLTGLGDQVRRAAQRQREVSGDTPVGAAAATPRAATQTPHFTLKNSGIRLSDQARTAVGRLADAYHARTGKNLVVTDGTRTAADQAQRMYARLTSGVAGDPIGDYRNVAAREEIRTAFRDARAAGGNPEQVRAAMAAVIQRQVDSGVYVSAHLREGGVDIRLNGMTAADQQAFRAAAAETGDFGTPYREGNPPHWHLQLRR